MKKVRCLAVCVYLAAVLSPVLLAQNPYVSFRGAPVWTENVETSDSEGERGLLEFGTGYLAGGALGYSFPSGLQVEGEFSYLYVPVTADGGVPLDGSTRNYLFMANLGYLFGRASSSPVKPFVGFGAGLAAMNEDHPYLENGALVPDPEHRKVFAYQARAGVAFAVADPVDLSVGYRYLRINGSEESSEGVRYFSDPFPHHLLEFGFTFRF